VRCSTDPTTSIFLAGQALSPSHTPISQALTADPRQSVWVCSVEKEH